MFHKITVATRALAPEMASPALAVCLLHERLHGL